MNKSWPNVKLGEVLTAISRPVAVKPDEIYREIGIRSHGKGVFHKEPISGIELGSKKVFWVEPGDFVLNIVFAWEGAVALLSEAEAGRIGSHRFPTFRADPARLDPRFLLAYFKTPTGLELLGRVSPGGAGRNRTLSKTSFLRQEIPLPSLAEQHRILARIVGVADLIQEARTLRQQTTEETEALLSARTTNLFNQLNSWPREAMRSLGAGGENPIQTGPFGAQLHSSEFVESGVPVLNVGNVWPGGLRLQNLDHVLPEKADQLSRYSLCTGDLLFARSGATLGKVCLVPESCDGWLMTGHLFRVRFDAERIDNRFAFAALRGARSIHDQIFGQVRGATRPGFNTTLLGNVELPLPSLPEQRGIVAELDALQAEVDTLKRLQAETAAELDALLPAILDQAFKGEL